MNHIEVMGVYPLLYERVGRQEAKLPALFNRVQGKHPHPEILFRELGLQCI